MPRLKWGDVSKRFFDTGLDRGVLYPKGTPPQGNIIYTNLIKQPSASEIANSTWVSYDPAKYSIVDSTVKMVYGTHSFKLTKLDSVGTYLASAYYGGPGGNTPLNVVPGRSYSCSIYVISGQAGYSGYMYVNFVNADGSVSIAFLNGPPVVLPPNMVTRVQATFNAPVGSAHAYPGIAIAKTDGSAGTSGHFAYVDAAMFAESSLVVPYFDGNTPEDGLYTYAWTGTPNNSESVKREKISLAVPWDGLTGVDENGADSAVAYYIDGRPFLFLPKPKEYQATIKAITYPDEFASIMGLVEAADGMYLDSQMGESFDLSYRTLVGSASDEDAGYKIHLVYNATAAPQNISNQTLGGSINPVEFGWDIQAVPVPVPGYRPTAHIVIDTRHMDAKKLAEIETMLYGNEYNLPKMPDPAEMLDLLSYGDAIVITDNGDGTWTAEGSYHNIYLIGDGVFEIDNINATDLGNGVYQISSTP